MATQLTRKRLADALLGNHDLAAQLILGIYTDFAAITAGLGASLVGVQSSGHTVEADITALLAGSGGMLQQRTVTIAFNNAALLAAVANGASASVNIGAVLPANFRVLGASADLATPLTGGGATSVAMDLGTAGDPVALVVGSDVLHAAVDGQAFTLPAGKAPNRHYVGAGAQLLARFTPDGAHALAGLTAGSVKVDVLGLVLA